jgi:hypothetical protein
MTTPKRITIRSASESDAEAIKRLAELEGVRPPDGDLLVADVDGEVWATIELDGGVLVADPFQPSGDIAELLHLRFKRLSSVGRRRWLSRWRVHPDPVACRA